MKKEHVMLMLCAIVIAITLILRVSELPKEVEEWYKRRPLNKLKLTKLHFYQHDILSGTNQSGYPVYASNISSTSISNFGLGFVFDNILTVGPEYTSMRIGASQGLASSASMTEPRFHTIINFVFTQGRFNGSTLQILGSNPLLNQVREVSVVGGTGVFRLATGTATVRNFTRHYTPSEFVRENYIYVLHY